MPDPRLILASGSPRRQELLTEAGFAFIVVPSNVDEDNLPTGLAPAAVAERLALAKAKAVANQHPDDIVLGADTVVAFGEQVLGKPLNEQHARQMLKLLEGTTHLVITAVAVVCVAQDLTLVRRSTSAVRMRRLKPVEIDRYVASGDWQGKAGGYGIQDPDPFVTNMAGSHSNIVGLPMEVTVAMLAQAGIHPRAAAPRPSASPTP